MVLLLSTTQKRTVIGKSGAPSSVVASKVVRAAKTAAEIENPENVHFENVLVPINPPPLSSPFERWWGGVQPIFVVCWDHPETGERGYQVLEINIISASSDEATNLPDCDKIRDTDYIQTLGASLPSFGIGDVAEIDRNFDYIQTLGASLPSLGIRDEDEIDEVLPRPAAPE